MAIRSGLIFWPRRLRALQKRLRLCNTEIAAKLGVPARTWISWKYGERKPSVGSRRLIELCEAGKI